MNQLLLCLITCFIFISIAQGQSEYADEKDMESQYFQNDKIVIKNKIEIYPNPAVENVFIKIDNSDLENVEIELFNIIGNSLKIEVEEISKNNYKIKVEDLPQGYYLLIIKDPIKRFNEAFKFHKVK